MPRISVIDINAIDPEAAKTAREHSAGSILAGQEVVMIGHDITTRPDDPTMSDPVQATCTECDKPIWSSELKEAVVHYSPPGKAHVCCVQCFPIVVRRVQLTHPN